MIFLKLTIKQFKRIWKIMNKRFQFNLTKIQKFKLKINNVNFRKTNEFLNIL